MAIWAEVKYALHSGVGNANIKPLDQLITSNWQIARSTHKLITYTMPTTSTVTNAVKINSGNITFNTAGECSLRVTANLDNFSAAYYDVVIFKNGTEIARKKGLTSTQSVVDIDDIEIGDVINVGTQDRISMSDDILGEGSTADITSVDILATPVYNYTGVAALT